MTTRWIELSPAGTRWGDATGARPWQPGCCHQDVTGELQFGRAALARSRIEPDRVSHDWFDDWFDADRSPAEHASVRLHGHLLALDAPRDGDDWLLLVDDALPQSRLPRVLGLVQAAGLSVRVLLRSTQPAVVAAAGTGATTPFTHVVLASGWTMLRRFERLADDWQCTGVRRLPGGVRRLLQQVQSGLAARYVREQRYDPTALAVGDQQLHDQLLARLEHATGPLALDVDGRLLSVGPDTLATLLQTALASLLDGVRVAGEDTLLLAAPDWPEVAPLLARALGASDGRLAPEPVDWIPRLDLPPPGSAVSDGEGGIACVEAVRPQSSPPVETTAEAPPVTADRRPTHVLLDGAARPLQDAMALPQGVRIAIDQDGAVRAHPTAAGAQLNDAPLHQPSALQAGDRLGGAAGEALLIRVDDGQA